MDTAQEQIRKLKSRKIGKIIDYFPDKKLGYIKPNKGEGYFDLIFAIEELYLDPDQYTLFELNNKSIIGMEVSYMKKIGSKYTIAYNIVSEIENPAIIKSIDGIPVNL